jgi:hypothetical protein
MENNNEQQVDEQNTQQTEQPKENVDQGESISGYVKQEVVSQLVEIGFSKIVAEKACFFNQSILEKSIEWIYEHQQDPDFEEELRIVGQQNNVQLSDEEIKKKAKELQEQARRKYVQKQKELEEEQEKNRVRQTKELLIAKREMEDADARRFIEIQKQKKKEEEAEKRRMLEILARDKEERFGKKFDPLTQGTKKEYTPFDNIEHFSKAIRTLYPTFRGEEAINCFNTLKVVLNNILKNPAEEKFRKVKMTNPNFHERVGKIQLAVKILKELGFEEDGEFMVVKNPDSELFTKSAKLFEDNVNSLSS